LNIGEYDLAAGYNFLKSLEENSKIPFISANLQIIKTGDLAFKPYVIIKRNKGQKYINELRDKVDILIILVNGNINQKNAIIESFKDADYVYLSRAISNTRSTVPQQEGYPIFYTFGINGKYLAEVKTTIKDNKEPIADVSAHKTRLSNIVRQLIRLKTTEGNQTIEEKYVDKPAILAQIKYYEKQVTELEDKLSKIINTSEIKIVAMPKNIELDQEMQSFIDKALEEAKNQ
jgi:2',3'-cyclic-nucleotide 2'-phosphodiesterase (5'-nucleotidase family)